jgi:hypothetical protein
MKKELRRIPMGVVNGVQQYQIVYDDQTSEYIYKNLWNNQWIMDNPYDSNPPGKTPADDGWKPENDSAFKPVGENPDDPPPPTGMAKGVFVSILMQLVGITSTAIAEEIWSAYFNSEYYGTEVDASLIPDLLVGTGKTPLFDAEFGAFLKIKKDPNNVTGITTLAEFMNARKEYKSLFAFYGLADLATNANADRLIEGNVSILEAQSRMNVAYDAINNADSILRSQLGSLNLSGSDLARALLLGKEAAGQLQDKIRTANILAAQVEADFTSLVGAEELARQGVSREQARQGLSITKLQTPGYTSEAQKQGISTGDLQKELEQENIQGLASARRRRIQQGAVARFSGQSGAVTQSLSKRTAGSI